jgi:hypothetical protein
MAESYRGSNLGPLQKGAGGDDWGAFPEVAATTAAKADDWSAFPEAGAMAPEAADHGLSERQKLSPLQKAVNPITSYPETYQRMNREARDQISRGVDQISNPDSLTDLKAHGISDVLTGAGNVALGTLGYVASPINAAYRSVIGQPVEDVTGIPREYTEFAAQLATPGIGLPGTAKSAVTPSHGTSASARAASAAERIGVDVPRGITTDSPLTAFTTQVVARAPGGGPLMKAIEESREGLQGAVATAANKAGGATDAAMAGDNYANAIEKSFKPSVKSGVSAAYDNVAAIMDKNKLTELSNTQGAVADILARRGESAIDGLGKAVDTVADAIKRPGGMTFDGIKGLRTHLGEMLDSGVFPEGMSQGELRRLYGTLSEDMKAAAFNSGGERGVAALERANELNKQVANWKEGIKKILGPESRSGEGVSGAIIRMASKGSSADIETLAKARSAVPKEVWQDIASTAIGRLGTSRNGEWTPAAFATDFRQLSDRGKALLFRSVGSGDVLPFLDDIAEVSQKFVDRGKLANTSGTAGHNALYAIGGAVAAGLAHLSFFEPLTAIGGIAGVNGTARLLARPATAASVAKWSRVYDKFAVSQTPAVRNALAIATRNLANTAAANGVKFSPSDLMRAIQSPVSAAAEDQQSNVPGRVSQ